MNKRAVFVWSFLLAILAAALLFFNLPADRPAAVGAAEGDTLPDFSVPCTDGSVFTLSDHRGETVVVNVWATWCAPCLEELPDFARLLRETQNVTVLALHSELVTEDVQAFLAERDYGLPFAVAPDAAFTGTLGVGAVLPHTLIVAPDGTVTYNRAGSLSYEALSALVGEAAGR